MPDAYHLLVQFQSGSLSAQMKALSLAYTKGMNARYNRVGSLFQGRQNWKPALNRFAIEFGVRFALPARGRLPL